MYQKLIAALAVGAMVAPAAQAENFPFIAPKCNVSIVSPDNSDVTYMNDDCKQVYVLPPTVGEVKIHAISKMSNRKLCAALFDAYEQFRGYSADYNSIIKEATEKMSLEEVEVLERRKAIVKEAIATVYQGLEKVPVANVQATYTRPSNNSWIGEYLKLNPNLGADYGIKFHAAPISEGYISFKGTTPKDTKFDLPAVLELDIPGISPPDADGKAMVDIKRMNGSMSGNMTLSLAGMCEYLENEPNAENVQDLTSYFTANFNYAVPVLSWAGYKARLDTDSAIHTLVDSTQNRTQFSTDDYAKLLAEGKASESFTFEATEMEQETPAFSDEVKTNFFKDLQTEVRSRLAARLLEQLKSVGFLEEMKLELAKAPEPGSVTTTHVNHWCHHHVFWWGHCGNYTYQVTVPRGSSASVWLEKTNNTNFSNTEEVSSRSIIYRRHTGTFEAPNLTVNINKGL